MSLFPIIGGAGGGGSQQPWRPAEATQPGAAGAHDEGPAAWLSNNASFQPAAAPADVLQPQAPYGNYATQAEFLRAAERYLESSSEDEGDDEEGPGPGGRRAAGGASGHGPAGASTAATATVAAAAAGRVADAAACLPKGADDRDRRRGGGRGGISDSEDGDRDRSRRRSKKRKHKRSSRSRSRSRDRKSRRKRRRGSSGGSCSGSSDSEEERRQRREKERTKERDKILRLERAAAAAGIAPREAAALTAGTASKGGSTAAPLLRGGGGGPQPGDTYLDTRGDLQNLVYECLYGTAVASYHRVDPMGLARGSRARRRLPGQVPYGGPAHGPGAQPPRFRSSMYDTEDEEFAEDEKARAAALAARYFGSRAVAVERSRRLPRLHLAEAPVLPGTSATEGRRRGAASAATGRTGQPRGWLLSKLDLGAAAGGGGGGGGGAEGYLQQGRMAMPLPAFLPLRDSAAEAAAAAAAQEAGSGQRRLPAELAAALAAAAAGGETSEEWVLRRTREYNTAVREAPNDVALWLRFAAFQDVAARLLTRRAGEVAGAAAEKKVAILQRALDAHPGHPALLRALMAASEPLLEPEALLDRWERLLRRVPGVPQLWRDYLARRRAAFASARLPGLQSAFGNALHALASERAALARQAAAAAAAAEPATSEAALEERAVLRRRCGQLDGACAALLLELVGLELGAGADEAAVARLQAAVEFHVFAPATLDRPGGTTVGAFGGSAAGGGGGGRLSTGVLLRLFDNFWQGGAPRVGEEGAAGWVRWYRRETEALWVARPGDALPAAVREKQAAAGAPDDDDLEERGRDGTMGAGAGAGGSSWSGWMEMPPLPPHLRPQAAVAAGAAGPAGAGAKAGGGSEGASAAQATGEATGETAAGEDEEEEEQEPEEEEADLGLTEEELLAQLGLKLDAQLEEMSKQGVPPAILSRWLRTEAERSARDWAPLRPPDHPRNGSSPDHRDSRDPNPDPDPDPHRVVLLDDIRDGIFPLEDPDLRRDLVLAGLTLLGAPLGPSSSALGSGFGFAAGPSGSAGSGFGSGSGPLGGASSVGCCSLSFLRLLPPEAAVAACRLVIPMPLPAPAGTAAPGLAAAGLNASHQQQRLPWYLVDESHRVFVSRLLRLLIDEASFAAAATASVGGAATAVGASGAAALAPALPQLCLAYLIVEASEPAAAASGLLPLLQPLGPNLDRARAAARGFLSSPGRRNSLAMLMALAALEEAAGGGGGAKAARRIRDAALAAAGPPAAPPGAPAAAAAAALPECELALVPLLVHQYAEAERAAASAAAARAVQLGAADPQGKAAAAAAAAALEHALRAHHVLRWFLSSRGPTGNPHAAAAAPYLPYAPYKAGGAAVTREDLAAARRGFEARIPGLLAMGGALDAASASTLYLGGLFEALTGRLFPGAASAGSPPGPGGGLAAALTIHKHATAAVPLAARRGSGVHEALAVAFGGLVVSELEAAAGWSGGGGGGGGGGPGGAAAVQPARARMLLLQAMELYPTNPELPALLLRLAALARSRCRLRTDLATAADCLRRSAAGTLDALATTTEAAERLASDGGGGGEADVEFLAGPDGGAATSAAAVVWWAQLAAESYSATSSTAGASGDGSSTNSGATGSAALHATAAATAADARLLRLLERAAGARHLAHVAPVWVAYLGHEAGAGRGAAAKRVFLRGVREVPLSKALWLQGLGLLGTAEGAAATGSPAGAGGAGAGRQDGGQQQQQQQQQQGKVQVQVQPLLGSREVGELLGVAGDKGLRLRTDVYEVMLEHLAEQQ
ncbi:hypothetical protein HYH02_009351 [Chlamydomonas schloesseri]|uniref:Uncharacterized protein n=1 Tax=Chlamydomonas schloesseri TaxID=2026947 RepID=A0A835TFR3_9CHLO|nr:hypothetical protein HYH02_009351 [Chlamydomonas schloesseri]|eukprot:KAG2443281.1 hypothetical protein HYH02_009351 [Chlamydomonas schloesseri]